jgi:FKBP-type peptidyl-prolyl cis-trans isomerase FkpA|tara:strand:- start:7 stop:456 length:450 start_codon:yes stop_codon:yes gene_type:complete
MYKKIWLALILMMYFTNSFSIEITTGDTKKMEDKIQELVIQDTKVGEGRVAEKGLTISVHYTGWLLDATKNDKKGQKFDSSLDRREPFNFVLGVGQVIKGWDDGFDGMKIGGSRTILIPSEMGYGSRGAGGAIPPNADLIFEVELLEIL